MKNLGDRIKSIRLRKGLNKTEFGKLFDATGSLVNKWENHDVSPSEARLKQIAKFGSMTVDELLYGNPNKNKSVDKKQTENFEEFVESKREVRKQEAKLLTPSVISGLATLGLGFKEWRTKAIENYELHQERIKALEKFGQDYINENYDNYTYDKYIKDYPDSSPQGFEAYKEKEWAIFKEVLENFWEAFDITNENYYWINSRFTNQIDEELNQISKIAVEEGKEQYYVNEIVQPFLDQAAKDFKVYIKDYIDTEE